MKRFYQKCLTTYITKNINTKERTFPFNIKTITGNNACKTVPGTSFPHFFGGGAGLYHIYVLTACQFFRGRRQGRQPLNIYIYTPYFPIQDVPHCQYLYHP